MIFLALIIFVILSYSPKWLFRRKYSQLESKFSWKIPLLKLAGTGMTLLLTFFLVFGIMNSTKRTFVENKNAVYGLRFSDTLKEFGFRDGMKIKYINGTEVDKVSSILERFVIEYAPVEIEVEKDGITNIILLEESDQITLLENRNAIKIDPVLFDSEGKNKIKVSVTNTDFSDIINTYEIMWKQMAVLLNPFPPNYYSMGGYTLIKINSLRSFLMVFSMNLMLLIMLNLLPFPGLGVGNFLISVIETVRKKLFRRKALRMIQIISIALMVILMGMRLI